MKHSAPGVILFDIALPDGTGFDVARYAERYAADDEPLVFVCMSAKPPTEIIEDVARHSIVRFIAKPFSLANLVEALREALFELRQRQQKALFESRERLRLQALQHEVLQRGAEAAAGAAPEATVEATVEIGAGVVVVQTRGENGLEKARIAIKDILHIEALGNKCVIVEQSGETHTISKTLAALEKELPTHDFVRTHRSYLVRKERIASTSADAVTLSNGETIPLARERVKPVNAALYGERNSKRKFVVSDIDFFGVIRRALSSPNSHFLAKGKSV